jgi:TRAP-type C4-dicarboxylate transport system substrate-binding protein
MNQRAWRSIPEKYRDGLLESVRRIEANLDRRVLELEDSVISTMEEYGLVITAIRGEQEKLWYADFQRSIPSLVGTIFDKEMYNRISAMLEKSRAQQ